MEDFMKVQGRIFDIQKYSIHDGPGIRTLVFFKGCVLRCRWCCNPESQEYSIQKMLVAGRRKNIGRDVTVEAVMEEIMQDIRYYERSGGGVTLSGGEALCQPDFAEALLKACKEEGLHTAIESTACVPYDTVKRILPYLDLYMMDIKHMNSDKHKEYTGKTNELILENAKKLARDAKELIIRVPVIPTFNNTKEEIRAIAEFAASLSSVKELHLLPYHRLGQDKYTGLDREYLLAGFPAMSEKEVEPLMEEVLKTGLRCQIGG